MLFWRLKVFRNKILYLVLFFKHLKSPRFLVNLQPLHILWSLESWKEGEIRYFSGCVLSSIKSRFRKCNKILKTLKKKLVNDVLFILVLKKVNSATKNAIHRLRLYKFMLFAANSYPLLEQLGSITVMRYFCLFSGFWNVIKVYEGC